MLKKKGQGTLEYALIIAVVVAGLLAMQFYVKRGYMGKLKSAADDMGEAYDPTAYSANFSVLSKSNTTRTMTRNGTVQTTYVDLGGAEAGYGQIQKKTLQSGSETLSPWGANESLSKQE